jgi:hypothetical protein
MHHPVAGILQLILVAAVVPASGIAGRALLLLLLLVLHPGRARAVAGALARARWLLLALTIAAALPSVIAGGRAEPALIGTVGAQLLPLLILITAVTVWVARYPAEVLSAAVALALRPLRFIHVDPARPAVILAGTLAAIPDTLARVQAIRSDGAGRMTALAGLLLDVERAPARGAAPMVPLPPMTRGATLVTAGWSLLLTAIVWAGL